MTETAAITEKTPKTSRMADEKYLAFQLLREQGMTVEHAAQLLGYKPRTGYVIERKLADRGLKLTLVSERRIRRAHGVVDKLLRGKKFGDIPKVLASDSLRAAEVVLDRAEPKRQESGAPTYNFTVINLDGYAPEGENPQNREIEVTPPWENGSEKVGFEESQ